MPHDPSRNPPAFAVGRFNRLFLFILLLGSWPAAGEQTLVACSDVMTDAEKTRLIFKTTASVSHQIFTLDSPDRAVIDIADARLIGKFPDAATQDPTLVGLRSGVRQQGDLRIVLDLKRPVRIKSFSTPDAKGYRLTVDLLPNTYASSRREYSAASRRVTPVMAKAGASRTAIIAIDAGHGGEDPGAIGSSGTREKDVTLAVARKLAQLVDKEPGMRALMIRNGDEFIGLRQRILKARDNKADMFISIHADAFNDTESHGSSVYTLSNTGASNEAAMWLADRENSADLIGGVDISASDDLLATVLLDMTQNATIEHSTEVANAVLSYLGKIGDLHKSDVQRAGFVVLKAPDIPSVLVETAFISNVSEEQRLTTNAHQQRLAQAIFAGIKVYLKKFPLRDSQPTANAQGSDSSMRRSLSATTRPRDATVAREYVINSGDTLEKIAKQHRVSLSSLRTENGLAEDARIRAGQILVIPES